MGDGGGETTTDPTIKVKAKKRSQGILDQNRKARRIDEMDMRTDDIVHFYTDSAYRDNQRDDPESPTLLQVNQLKPWADVYLAALSYGRFTPTVLPVPVRPAPLGMNEPVRRLLDQWLNTQALAEKLRRCAQVSLLEGEAALYFDIDWSIAQEDPQAAISVDVVTRKNLLIDRLSKQSRVTYLGMLLEKPPNGWKDHEPDDTSGQTDDEQIPKRKTYMYLYDLDRSIPVSEYQDGPTRYRADTDGDSDDDTDTDTDEDADDEPEDLGIYICACIEAQAEDNPESKYTVKEIEDVAPIIYVDPWGKPVAPILPILLTPHPNYPQRGMPAALTPFNLAAAKNILRSWQLQSGRADMSRIRAFDPSRVDQADADGIKNGDLIADVWLKPTDPGQPVPTTPPITFVAPPQVPDTVKGLDVALTADFQVVSGVSPLLMGQMQGKGYSTATESQMAGAYSEASIAPLKTLLNTRIAELSQLFLSVLAAVCHNTGTTGVKLLEPDGSVVEIPIEAMLYPWNIAIDDSASTPQADQQMMALWAQVDPILRQILVDYQATQGGTSTDPENGLPVTTPGNPMLQQYLEQSYRRYHQLWRLPETLSWDAITAKLAAMQQAPQGVPMMTDAQEVPPVAAGLPAALPIPPDVTGTMEAVDAPA